MNLKLSFSRPARVLPKRSILAYSGNEGNNAVPVRSVKYDSVLVAVLENNPNLSSGTRSALEYAVSLAAFNDTSSVTVVIPASNQRSAVSVALEGAGMAAARYTIVEKEVNKVPGQETALLGDLADEHKADLLVLSTEVVHSKKVDANLLAEFVACPVLLLP